MSIEQFMDFALLFDSFYIASPSVLSIIKWFGFVVKLIFVEELEAAEVGESHPDNSCCVKEK